MRSAGRRLDDTRSSGVGIPVTEWMALTPSVVAGSSRGRTVGILSASIGFAGLYGLGADEGRRPVPAAHALHVGHHLLDPSRRHRPAGMTCGCRAEPAGRRDARR
jgi:hypothetical protein